MAVYGIIPASTPMFVNRTVSASYAIDGGEPRTLSISPSTYEGRAIAMSQLFLSERLPEGKHTLVVKVTEVPDLTMHGFGLDFVTYNASFDNLAEAGRDSSAAHGDDHTLVWQPVLGALLGFLALLIGVFGWLWWRRRKQTKARAEERASKVYVVDNWKARSLGK